MTEVSLAVPFSFIIMACPWLLWGQSWQERTDKEKEGERKGGEERERSLVQAAHCYLQGDFVKR